MFVFVSKQSQNLFFALETSPQLTDALVLVQNLVQRYSHACLLLKCAEPRTHLSLCSLGSSGRAWHECCLQEKLSPWLLAGATSSVPLQRYPKPNPCLKRDEKLNSFSAQPKSPNSVDNRVSTVTVPVKATGESL